MDSKTHDYLIGTFCTANLIGLYDFQVYLTGEEWQASINVFEHSKLQSSKTGLYIIGENQRIPDLRPHMNLKVISCNIDDTMNVLLITFEDKSWIKVSSTDIEDEAFIVSSKFGFWVY